VREPATESGELPNQKTFFRVGMGKREQVRGSSTPSPTRFPSRKIFFHACFPPPCAPAGRLRPRSPPRSSDPGAPQLHRAAPIWARPNPTTRLQPLRGPSPPLASPAATCSDPCGWAGEDTYWTAADLSSTASATSCSPQVRISDSEDGRTSS
jgi:hypothetical protein